MRAWAEINLDIIENNMRQIRSATSPDAQVMAIIKADAYGHGFCEIASTLSKAGADQFGVATADEAIQLRNAGFDLPILILGAVCNEDISKLIKNNIMLAVFNYTTAKTISDSAVELGINAKIHIKLDTGMSRIGYMCNDDANINNTVNEIADICKLPNLEIVGIFSHLAKADETDANYTHMQYRRFENTISRLEEINIHIPVKHICNSAGILQYPEYHMDMVRSGIILYGLEPSNSVDIRKANLKPAMQLKSVVTNIKTVNSDTPVSYGGKHIAKNGSRIATVSIGYADGFSRVLSNKAQVIINGKIANIIGNICMDQLMVDASEIDDIKIGDEVILFGSDGNNIITVESVADLMGTINYEIVCAISKRVPRVYIRNGKTVNVLNYLA